MRYKVENGGGKIKREMGREDWKEEEVRQEESCRAQIKCRCERKPTSGVEGTERD